MQALVYILNGQKKTDRPSQKKFARFYRELAVSS